MKDNQRTEELRTARKKALEVEMEAFNLRNKPGVSKAEYEKKVSQLAALDDFTSGLTAYENAKYPLALEYFKKAGGSASVSSADVYYMLGKVYAGMGDTKKSDANFKKAADMGHPAAQYRIRKQGYKRK
jgi:tetratricopeptide (TPR) repeat protein